MNHMFPCFDGPPCLVKINKDGMIDYHGTKFVMRDDDGKKYKDKYAFIFAGEKNAMAVTVYKTKNDALVDTFNKDKMLSELDVWVKVKKERKIK